MQKQLRMSAIDALVKSFLQKESLEECSVLELQQLARNYPYASAAQLLLAEKMKATSATGTEKQFERTSLYFNGPLWQDIFSSTKGEAVITPAKKETIIGETSAAEQTPVIPAPASEEETEEIPTLATVDTPVEETIKSEPEQKTESPVADTEQTELINPAFAVEMEDAVIASEPEHKFETTIADSEEHSEQFTETTDIIADNAGGSITENIHGTVIISEPAPEPPFEEEQVAESTIIAEHTTHPDTPEYEEQPADDVNEETAFTPNAPIIGTVIAGETGQSSEPMKTEDMHEQEPLPEIPGLKIEPIDPATAELSFTPFYTVDYFASQGIKFKEDDQPRDKFGRQLKSFTEWLKILKKVPGVTTAAGSGKQPDKKVEQMAAHSVTNEGEVVTEAMAEVWEKQDNPQKAITIYEKLSLLNPGKRAYFAAKIDQLKNS